MTKKYTINARNIQDIIDKTNPDIEKLIKNADRTFLQEIIKLNNKIKEDHPWGRNRTYNLRAGHKAERKGLFKASIKSEAPYSAPLYYGHNGIKPVKAKVLSWIDFDSGERVFAKSVKPREGNPWIIKYYDKEEKKILERLAKAMIGDI